MPGVYVYVAGQPWVATAPCTDSGLDSMAGLWFSNALFTQPWKDGREVGRPGIWAASGEMGENNTSL